MADKFAQALTAMAVLLLAAVVFLGGLGFLAAAAHAWLATQMTAAAAAAVVGAGGVVLALLMLLVARSTMQPKAKPRQSGSAASNPSGPSAGAAEDPLAAVQRLGEQAGPLLARHWKGATAGAFAVGVILGVSPRARRALIDAIRRQL